MKLSNPYFTFPAAIDAVTCQNIIDAGMASGVEKANTQGNIDHEIARKSKVSWITDNTLYDMLTPYLEQANQAAGWKFEWDYCEQLQFTCYDKDDYYGWHQDGGSDHNAALKRYIYGVTPVSLRDDGRIPKGYIVTDGMVGKVRKLSMTLNLTDPTKYDGGDFCIDVGNYSNPEFVECQEARQQGSILVFPSFVNHCVTTVTAGTRYSLVMWAMGRPFR